MSFHFGCGHLIHYCPQEGENLYKRKFCDSLNILDFFFLALFKCVLFGTIFHILFFMILMWLFDSFQHFLSSIRTQAIAFSKVYWLQSNFYSWLLVKLAIGYFKCKIIAKKNNRNRKHPQHFWCLLQSTLFAILYVCANKLWNGFWESNMYCAHCQSMNHINSTHWDFLAKKYEKGKEYFWFFFCTDFSELMFCENDFHF